MALNTITQPPTFLETKGPMLKLDVVSVDILEFSLIHNTDIYTNRFMCIVKNLDLPSAKHTCIICIYYFVLFPLVSVLGIKASAIDYVCV